MHIQNQLTNSSLEYTYIHHIQQTYLKKPTSFEVKMLRNMMCDLLLRRIIQQYFANSVHLKSGLIRGVVVGGSGLIREGLVYPTIPILPVFDLEYTVAQLLPSVAQRSSLLQPQGVVAHDVSLLVPPFKQKHFDSLKKVIINEINTN